jgi:hypothetical protein
MTQPEPQPLWTNTMIYEWSDKAKESVLHKNGVREMVSVAQAEGLAETIRDDYQALLQQIIAERDAALAKFETCRECAEILKQLLTDARATLTANGIYEDWDESEESTSD